MTDETAGLFARGQKLVRSSVPSGLGSRLVVGMSGALFAWAIGAILIGQYMLRYEGGWPNLRFVIAATLLTAVLIVLATGRLLIAAILVPTLVGIIVHAGAVKHHLLQMNLHAYDVIFYLTSGPTLGFMWSEYRSLLAQLIAAVAGTIAFCVFAYRIDTTRVSRLHALGATVLMIAMTALAANYKGERSHTQQYWDDLTLSTFYSSMSDAVDTLWRGQLIDAARDSGGLPAFAIPHDCTTGGKPPHIVLIHQESVVPPAIVPGVDYDKSLDPFFKSFDGKTHTLRVETYGGASWLTEFSILMGVSTYSFGTMRTFVHSAMSGKIRDTLPETLTRCGYRNVAFFPGDKNFVSYAKFYSAAGIPEIRDIREMKGTRINERDRFYYDQALGTLEKQIKESSKPLFAYVLTMATHGPYDRVYAPELNVPGGGPGTNPEMNEFLRRLALAHEDYNYLIAELKRRFPGEKILVVHYGDHHPVATRAYLGYGDVEHPQDVPLAKDSIGFHTYYAVQGINYEPPPLPDVGILDVPYLGMVVIDSARLPLSDANRERKRLLQVCGGRYYGCEDRRQILTFHRRLIDSGLLDVR